MIVNNRKMYCYMYRVRGGSIVYTHVFLKPLPEAATAKATRDKLLDCTPPPLALIPRLGVVGEKVAGNTYTMAEARSPGKDTGPDDLGDVWVEVGLREGDVRVRSVFQYGRAAEGASLRRVFLVREGLNRLPTGDGTKEVIEREGEKVERSQQRW